MRYGRPSKRARSSLDLENSENDLQVIHSILWDDDDVILCEEDIFNARSSSEEEENDESELDCSEGEENENNLSENVDGLPGDVFSPSEQNDVDCEPVNEFRWIGVGNSKMKTHVLCTIL